MLSELEQLRLENAQLKAQLAEQKREADLLRQFDLGLTRNEALDRLLDYALDWLLRHLSADHGLIARWNKERRSFEIMISTGQPLGQTMKTRDLLPLPDLLMPAVDEQPSQPEMRLTEDETCLVSALRLADGTFIGVVLLQRAHPQRRFSPEDRMLVRLLSDRLALSIHQASLLGRVQALSQHRSQLFRMLSHDLRQPLTVLVGYIQLVQLALMQDNRDVLEEYLAHIARGAKELSSLLEEVLLMERVANISRDEWEVVSLKKLVEKAVDKYRGEAQLKKQTFEVSIAEQDAMCKGMSVELREAAGNLIGNAIKYTPEGGRVKVALEIKDGRFNFTVEDNGYGIDKKLQTRLFEPFYRAQQPGTAHIKGTGLGLNLVKAIIEKHDGRTFFTSEAGVGSTFGFWIPVYEDEKKETTPAPSEKSGI